jgi:hypothetical protein
MAYTTINKSTDYFNTKLYTGNGTDDHAITGVGFQPDFIWVKARSAAKEHRLQNSVSGITNHMRSNATNAESAGSVKTADSDGFTLGTGASWNENSTTFASWNWLANGAGSSNTDGSITSTVSVNTTAGFSIVKWTGSGATATIGHGLGSVPKMIIVKNTQASENCIVYHSTLGSSKHLKLNLTDAEATTGGTWNHTNPTANVFTVHTNTNVNASGNSMIAYCFAEKTGYSKFGSYTGAGSNLPFIYTGFKPAFIIVKKTNSTFNWIMYDNKRDELNPNTATLLPDDSGAEYNIGRDIDFLSNGFKMRANYSGNNNSGDTYIYMAFAAAPLVGTNNVPCTAR